MTAHVPEHLLGYTHGRSWLDMSRYLVHFTEDEDSFCSILREGFLRPSGPFGWGRKIQELEGSHMSACLSEVPLTNVPRLMERHGSWGIVFRRDFVARAGGGRVWYLDEGTPLNGTVFTWVGDLMRAQDFDSPLWELTPFMDGVGPNLGYQFEWEREWRVPGGLRFTLEDIMVWPNANGVDAQGILESVSLHVRPPWTPSGEILATIESNVASLGSHANDMVEQFFRYYTNPLNELYFDADARSGFFWSDSPCTTQEAVDHVFGRLEPSVREALIQTLDGTCQEWLYIGD